MSATLELLAPARDADIGIAAIDHGADAVYIGGPAFGARANAGNDIADIERLVRHAHRFHARVFVTHNTILRDDELEPARRLAWQLHAAGVDALIVQDMGLLELDLPPIQLHASTQTDIRTPQKARFLQDAGFSQMVLARELDLRQIAQVRAAIDPARTVIEFFIHGALCVAYSGQCYVSHALTGRSANRGDCSQACRLPYQVTDGEGRIVASGKHVLSMKDNNQSANLAALVDAGVRSFKIEGRYKDLGYVKNITAHYRRLFDALLDARPELARASSGRVSLLFEPDPERNFNRGATDYFVNGRQQDIGAFDTPKNPGLPIGWIDAIGPGWIEVATEADEGESPTLNNGDGLCYQDHRGDLVGFAVNRAEDLGPAAAGRPDAAGDGSRRWRLHLPETISGLKDLRTGIAIRRNRDARWDRLMDGHTAERRIGVAMTLSAAEPASGDGPPRLQLHLVDDDGVSAGATLAADVVPTPARDPLKARDALRTGLSRLGNTVFALRALEIGPVGDWFLPAAAINALRRDGVAALEAARAQARRRLPRAAPVEPPVPYPEDTLTYLANVFNHKARDFYARHGVKIVASAYESHEEEGEVSLMITKHCVRFSLSLCPKQAKGVTGVQGTVRAEPLSITHGTEKLTLRFDCKPCEMHVVGSLKRSVALEARSREKASLATPEPIHFYRTAARSAS